MPETKLSNLALSTNTAKNTGVSDELLGSSVRLQFAKLLLCCALIAALNYLLRGVELSGFVRGLYFAFEMLAMSWLVGCKAPKDRGVRWVFFLFGSSLSWDCSYSAISPCALPIRRTGP